MRRFSFRLKPYIQNNLIEQNKYKPWVYVPRREYIGEGTPEQAKILSVYVDKFDSKITSDDGKLFIIDKRNDYNKELTPLEIGRINREIRTYGSKAEDVYR